MPLMDCDPPATPVPILGGTDYINRLSFLWPNLIRFSRFSFTGGAVAVNPFTDPPVSGAQGAQKKAIAFTGGVDNAALITDRTPGPATVGHNGAAYNISFDAWIVGGGTSATVTGQWRDSVGGVLSSSSFGRTDIADAADDLVFNVTDTLQTFKWEGVASDDPDFFAAAPNNVILKLVSLAAAIPSGSMLYITNFQLQVTDFYAPWKTQMPWRPAPGEEDLAQYAEYILSTNYDEMVFKPGQRLVSNPSGGNGPVLTPSGPARFLLIPETTYTLAANDDGTLLIFTNADGCTVTASAYADVALQTKGEVYLRRATGAGPVVVAAGAGATLAGPPGCIFTLTSEEGEARLLKAAEDNWLWSELVGNPTNIGGVTIESGDGVPTRTDRADGSIYIRNDVSQVWRYDFHKTHDGTTQANIAGTDQDNDSSNVVTLSTYSATQRLSFSKPAAASSGGALTWDATSLWPNDVGGTAGPPPVSGQTYLNWVTIYGVDGGGDHQLFHFDGDNGGNYFATAAAALAAIQAVLPVEVTGYTSYKVAGFGGTGNETDNRFGLSILADVYTPGWVLMSDLTEIKDDGTPLTDPPRSIDFTGAGVTTTSDGEGHFTVTIAGSSPGGSSGQIQYNNSGVLGGFTVSGDGTLVTSTGVLTITKLNGVSPGLFFSGTDAANLTGTLSASRIASGSITLAKIANIADQTILGNNTGSSAAPVALTASQVRAVLGTVIGTNVQAWDADLDALAALSGTNTIYYRSASNTWTGVTIGTQLSFSGGTLNVIGGGGGSTGSGVTIAQLQANFSIGSGVFAKKSWAAGDIIRDDVTAWSSGAATRFTTPSGYTKVRITSKMSWATSASTSYRWLNIYKNGTFFNGIHIPASLADSTRASFTSNWIIVAAADYFEVEWGQNTGGALNLTGSATNGADAASIQFEWAP